MQAIAGRLRRRATRARVVGVLLAVLLLPTALLLLYRLVRASLPAPARKLARAPAG